MNHSLQAFEHKVAVLIVAAGVGARAGGDKPKQYQELGGLSVLRRTLDAFMDALPETPIWVAIHAEHVAVFEDVCGDMLEAGLVRATFGGESRAESVQRGLQAISDAGDNITWVMVHDAARPFVSESLLLRLLDSAVEQGDAMVIPSLAVVDTVKAVEGERVLHTVARESLRLVQTPQVARLTTLLHAHNTLAARGELGNCTDDASVMSACGYPVRTIDGEPQNRKITMPEDFADALTQLSVAYAPRVGMGYDVHQFEPHDAATPLGEQVIMLGGVAIPFERKLKGHSDADVVLHALVDALLGAIGAGDIGQHFPPSDARWKNANSAMFVEEAVRLMEERGGRLENVDVTYIGEAPKVGKYREAMQARMADLLGVSPQRVNVKATTTEKLGFTGREEGAAANAVALVMMPSFF